MEFAFVITADRLQTLSREMAAAQVKQALEVCIENDSRKRLPRLWDTIDNLHQRQKFSNLTEQKRHKSTKFLAVRV